jgi:hypothetical protein
MCENVFGALCREQEELEKIGEVLLCLSRVLVEGEFKSSLRR